MEKYKQITIENHPACPKCGSGNTGIETDFGACLCEKGDCWSHPECRDCGFRGYMNSEGVFWFSRNEIYDEETNRLFHFLSEVV